MGDQTIPGLGPTPTLLREMEERDRDAVERLWFDRFDHDPEGVDWVFNQLDRENFKIRGVVATRGTEIVGFGVAYPYNKEAVEERYYGGILSGLPKNAGIFHMGVVAEGYESKGIGTQLFQDRVDYLSRFRPHSYIGTSWIRPDGHSSAALFEKFGFTAVAEISDYYSEGRECAACGPDEECQCSARIYVYPEDVAANVEVSIDE
jgi:ribosomal protein S18 acetylase RimI-like enzyme